MKRLLALLLLCCQPPASPQPEVAPGLATLAIMDSEGIRCGAVVVTPQTFITSASCTNRGTVNYVTFEQWEDNSGFGVATLRPSNAWSPLAVYVANRTFVFSPQLRVTPQGEGEEVYLVSHADRPWNVSATRVQSPMVWVNDSFYMTTMRMMDYHDGGAGLWSTSGELLGIAIYNEGPRTYYAHAIEVARVLRASKAP